MPAPETLKGVTFKINTLDDVMEAKEQVLDWFAEALIEKNPKYVVPEDLDVHAEDLLQAARAKWGRLEVSSLLAALDDAHRTVLLKRGAQA